MPTQATVHLTLLSNFSRSSAPALHCGSSFYREDRRVNLGAGRFLLSEVGNATPYGVRTAPREMATHSFQYISESGYDTGACFWDHIQTTYGMDAFRRVILHFRDWRKDHPGQFEINAVHEIASVLNRSDEEVRRIFQRFNLDPDWFTRQRIAPLCR